MKKKIALLLAMAVCVFALSACVDSGADGVDDGSVTIEDIEDVEINYGFIRLVNMMGKDAVELYARPTGTKEWSKTILSEDSLKTNVEVLVTYTCTQTNENVFDLKLVFDDGTSQEFTSLDFEASAPTIYLGLEE